MKVHISVRTDEDFKKAIPSIVYFNHFNAIAFHLKNSEDRYELKKVQYFNMLRRQNAEFDLVKSRHLFWNSWSTEHAFLFARRLGDREYFKYSLQWGFPQVYYAAYLGMTAFRETQEKQSENHEKAIKVFGNSVKDGHYPMAISFYAAGLYENFTYQNLPNFLGSFEGFNSVAAFRDVKGAETQIANFLKTTRERNAMDKRDRLERANDHEFLSKSGQFLKRFRKNHWDKIYTKIPVTSIMNMLYRLRIKANYRDIETFLNADIAFHEFHDNLASILNYLSFIHEAYFAKALGSVRYEAILEEFPKRELIEDTAMSRYNMMQELGLV